MSLPAIRLRPREATPSLAKGDPVPPATRALLESILPIAAHRFGVGINDILRNCRQPEKVRARAFVVWALRLPRPPLSYPAIAALFGERDHTGMIYLHEKAIRLRLADAEFSAACERLGRAFATYEETHDGDTRH